MLRLLNYFYFVLLLAATGQDASAFSMIGAFNTTWHTLRLGYLGVDGQIGGPMNLGEEYRWNAPLIYYAVDGTFLDYFGARGREEIDKAVRVLNELPPMSQVTNLDIYPLKTERSNYRAQALGLIDLKSFALATIVEEMGLGSPSRFVFTLRNRWIDNPLPTNYLVIKRNFDPVTLTPSSYINGDLWTYITIIDEWVPGGSLVINGRVDPLAYGNPVADLNASPFTSFTVGSFFTGLTRDDVGGLRYIYNPANKNVETAITNAFGASFGGGPWPSTGGNASGSPWEPFFISSNGVSVIGGGANSPWSPVAVNTNTTTGGGGGGVGGPITVITNAFIDAALRSGIDKVSFVRVDYDSLLGQFIAPVLDSFSDTFITNGAPFTQNLQRIVTAPDILFTAGDLAQGDASGVFPFLARTLNWQNNALLNNRRIAGDSGPGTIQPAPSVIITFSTFGPAFVSSFPAPLSEESSFQLVTWGSFDGTTNEPVVYPNGTSIQDIERLVLGQP